VSLRGVPMMGADGLGSRDRPPGSAPIPPWVRVEDHRRWSLAEAIALYLFEGDPGAIWQATRAIFRSSIPTGEE
jgi:hypothetical protein